MSPGTAALALVGAVKVLGAGFAVLAFPAHWRPATLTFSAHLLAFSVAGGILLVLGRHDRRAVLLGCFLLLTATAFADPLLRAVGPGAPPAPLLRLLAEVQPAAFQPFIFSLFARDFPRREAFDGREHSMAVVRGLTLAVGVGLFAANLALALLPPGTAAASVLRPLDRNRVDTLFWPILFLAGLPALAYVGMKAGRARPSERRRVHLLIAGTLFGVLPMIALTLAEAASPALVAPALTPTGRLLELVLVQLPLLSIPFTTAYAVLVHHALDVRLLVRRALQYALARWTLLAATGVPFVLVVALGYARREQSLAAVLSGRGGLLLLALATTGALALRLRRQVLAGLDRYFFRDQYDARAVLGGLVERSRRAGDVAELTSIVPAAIDRALHVHRAALLLRDPATQTLAAPGGEPLPSDSALGRQLSAGRLIEADWSGQEPWVGTLSTAEQQWLADADARLLVPVAAGSGTLLGAIVVGDKRSELPFSGEDRLLLKTIAEAVGLAVESRGLPGSAAGPADVPAAECPDCGRISASAGTCPRCGRGFVVAPVPALLAGKYQPVERIGRGGMGVVYRARDLTLERDVALKTLPALAPADAARLHREARAMAAVSHPNLAAIHAAESWRGTPILVVELLSGGTLAERLRRERLAPAEAFLLGGRLAAGLAELHAAGILHRDIKPSNIGFSASGAPKLLDFGLARVQELVEPQFAGEGDSAAGAGALAPGLTRTGSFAGTLAYLSPELARGEPPGPAADLWALSLAVYEAVAGRNPLAEGTPHLVLYRISIADVPDLRALLPDVPAAAADFLRDCLHADVRRRPRTAREWRRRAEAARRALGGSPRSA